MLGGQETRLAVNCYFVGAISRTVYGSYRGYFQGFGDMKPTGISQVIEQLCEYSLC